MGGGVDCHLRSLQLFIVSVHLPSLTASDRPVQDLTPGVDKRGPVLWVGGRRRRGQSGWGAAGEESSTLSPVCVCHDRACLSPNAWLAWPEILYSLWTD